ncbi:hypothetical protein AB5N19_03988 [Seiridium cardinale]
MALSYVNLERNNIYISHSTPLSIPRHIRILNSVFLDDHGTIQKDFNLVDGEDPWKAADDPLWKRKSTDTKNSFMRNIQHAELVQDKALKRLRENHNEDSWNNFYRTHFFEPLKEKFESRKDDIRTVSRQKYFYDSFDLIGNEDWDLFDKFHGFRSPDREGLSHPKPDLVCYFPILDTGDEKKKSTPERSFWKHTAQERLAQNLSGLTYKTLIDLEKFGLKFSPRRLTEQRISKGEHLQCFPWLIVEYKKQDKKKEEQCYCQAANAGSAALMLLQTAATFAEFKEECQHVPPVVTVTTIGRSVRVWVVYYHRADGHDAYEMKTIWKGDMTNVSNILRFESILDNVHTWATRTLKPLLSAYIAQWRHRFLDGPYRYGTSLHDLRDQLQRPGDGDVPTALNLAKILDEAVDKGFYMGRQHALTFDHQLLLDATRYVCLSENTKMLRKVENIIESKLEDIRCSIAAPAPVQANSILESKIDDLRATLAKQMGNDTTRKTDTYGSSLEEPGSSSHGKDGLLDKPLPKEEDIYQYSQGRPSLQSAVSDLRSERGGVDLKTHGAAKGKGKASPKQKVRGLLDVSSEVPRIHKTPLSKADEDPEFIPLKQRLRSRSREPTLSDTECS